MSTTEYPYTIAVGQEKLLDRLETARHVAKLTGRARPVHKNQIGRWWRTGIRGVQLPSVLVAGTRYTSEEAVAWWIRATSAATAPRPTGADSAATTAPLTDDERRTLAAAGISEVA